MYSKKILTFFFCALAVLFFTPSGSSARTKVIITNDVHGHVMSDAENGEIGYALLKSYIEAQGRAGWRVYLLDSGDAFSGSAYAQADHGRSVAEIIAMLGYTVLTPGNHAFDYNEAENDPLYYSRVLLETVKKNTPGPFRAVAQNISYNGATIPGLENKPVVIHDETTENPQGRRIIVTGLVTPYTARPNLKDSLAGYDFGSLPSPAATREKLLAELAAALAQYSRPADCVIVLSHLGYFGPEGDRGGRVSGPDLAMVANVDFVADGHTHGLVTPRRIEGAVYANGGRYLEHFLEISLEDGQATGMEVKSYADLAGLVPDHALAVWLENLTQRQGLADILFELPPEDSFSDRGLYTDNIPLGRLICRSMSRITGADAALHNLGGIRAGLPPGPVSARALYDALPFGDELVTVSLRGKELTAFFEHGSGHGGQGFPQFYGLTVYAWRAADGRLHCAGVRGASGNLLREDERYLVAMNGFMAKNIGLDAKKHGRLVMELRNDLSGAPLRPDELLGGNPLLIFPDRASAAEACAAGSSPL